MPRLNGIPNKIYTESGKISQDVKDFNMSMSFTLLDETDIETKQVKRQQGLRDSNINYNAFLDSDRQDIDDSDHAFMFIVGSSPYPVMLFKGLITASVETSRSTDTSVNRDITAEQGSSEGFRNGKWFAVEDTKEGGAAELQYIAPGALEEVWASHGLAAGIRDGTGPGSDNEIFVDSSSLSDGDTVLLAFKLQ